MTVTPPANAAIAEASYCLDVYKSGSSTARVQVCTYFELGECYYGTCMSWRVTGSLVKYSATPAGTTISLRMLQIQRWPDGYFIYSTNWANPVWTTSGTSVRAAGAWLSRPYGTEGPYCPTYRPVNHYRIDWPDGTYIQNILPGYWTDAACVGGL